MSKFDTVTKTGTIGTRYGIATSDIVETLERWDTSYGLEIRDVGRNRLSLGFRSLPRDLTRLAEEVYGICPSVIAQHASYMKETLAVMEGAGLGDLTADPDFEEELGLELIEETLRTQNGVSLRWD